jgi:hypothetical protein
MPYLPFKTPFHSPWALTGFLAPHIRMCIRSRHVPYVSPPFCQAVKGL